MANTKSTTTGRAASSRSKTSKGASSKAPASKAASIAPDESDLDEFDEFDAVRQLQAKAEAAAQDAETAAQEAENAAQEAEDAAQEAEAAAEAALAARAALSQRSKSTQSDDDAPSRPARRKPKTSQPNSNENYLGMMSGLLDDMSATNWDDDKFDEMSQSVAMVMGTGPAFASLGTMLANSTAQSSVLMNATQMQRQLDMVGLSCTSACVQQLLNMNNGSQDSD